MSFQSICPHCKHRFEAEDDWLGVEAECPECNESFTVKKLKKKKPAIPPKKPDAPTVTEEPVSNAQPSTNSKKPLLLIVGALIIILIIGVGAFFIFTQKDETSKTNASSTGEMSAPNRASLEKAGRLLVKEITHKNRLANKKIFETKCGEIKVFHSPPGLMSLKTGDVFRISKGVQITQSDMLFEFGGVLDLKKDTNSSMYSYVGTVKIFKKARKKAVFFHSTPLYLVAESNWKAMEKKRRYTDEEMKSGFGGINQYMALENFKNSTHNMVYEMDKNNRTLFIENNSVNLETDLSVLLRANDHLYDMEWKIVDAKVEDVELKWDKERKTWTYRGELIKEVPSKVITRKYDYKGEQLSCTEILEKEKENKGVLSFKDGWITKEGKVALENIEKGLVECNGEWVTAEKKKQMEQTEKVAKAIEQANSEKTYNKAIEILQTAVKENPEATNLEKAKKAIEKYQSDLGNKLKETEMAKAIKRANQTTPLHAIQILNDAIRKYPDATSIDSAKSYLNFYTKAKPYAKLCSELGYQWGGGQINTKAGRKFLLEMAKSFKKFNAGLPKSFNRNIPNCKVLFSIHKDTAQLYGAIKKGDKNNANRIYWKIQDRVKASKHLFE